MKFRWSPVTLLMGTILSQKEKKKQKKHISDFILFFWLFNTKCLIDLVNIFACARQRTIALLFIALLIELFGLNSESLRWWSAWIHWFNVEFCWLPSSVVEGSISYYYGSLYPQMTACLRACMSLHGSVRGIRLLNLTDCVFLSKKANQPWISHKSVALSPHSCQCIRRFYIIYIFTFHLCWKMIRCLTYFSGKSVKLYFQFLLWPITTGLYIPVHLGLHYSVNHDESSWPRCGKTGPNPP